ncbi:MAG: hypothetical protein JNK53_08260, partial [Phycisphaerae bacterium]|nr:hypothetical protein [Phycisphaerae bacterium]
PSPHDSAQAFLQQHGGIFGVSVNDMAPIGPFEDGAHLVQIMPDRVMGVDKFTGVYYTQTVGGVPVFLGHLCVLVRNETGFPAVLASSTLWDTTGMQGLVAGKNLSQLPHPDVYTRHALNAFREKATVFPAQYVIWAGADRVAAVEPRLAVLFEVEGGGVWTPADHQRIQFVVDAETGDILYQENRIYDVDGQVRGNATINSVADTCAAEIPMGMPYAKIVGNNGSGNVTVYADANGNYSFGPMGAATYTYTMGGQFFIVSNNGGAPMSEVQNLSDGATYSPLFSSTNASEAERAQVNAYMHANIIRDLVLDSNPSFPSVATQSNFPITVNIADTCNANYSNSTINFFASGGGCANTAFGTVVHHEFGHNVVAKAGSGQGAYGEGYGDVCGVLVTDVSGLGIGFQSCATPLRDANNSCQYLASGCSSCGSAIHSCGRLLSGCVWSLRNELMVDYPGSYRQKLADLCINSVLLHGAVTTITPAITVDFLTLDDDDGEVLNGTPNYNRIAAAFNAHSMTAPTLLPIKFKYPNGRPTTANPNGTTTVRVDVQPLSGTPIAGSGKAFVRPNSGASFAEVPLTVLGANSYELSIPAGPCGSEPSYYFTAQAVGGSTTASPTSAPTASWSTILATGLSTPVTDEFETSTGWLGGIAGDTATTGVWVREDPVGTAAQPEDDHTPSPGTICWVTGNAAPGAALGANDVDGGVTTLISPAFDLASFDVIYVSYWRWYSNNTGGAPNEDVMPIEVSNNNGVSWVTLETVSENANAWVFKRFLLNDYITLTSQVRIRFRAQDLGTGSLVEAAIDDFALSAAECTPIIPGDLDGDGDVDGADLGILLAGWATNGPSDLNGDGFTDGADLGILLSNWG